MAKTRKLAKCKKREIRVKTFRKKDGTRVKAYCRKDLGMPGKSEKLFTLKKGELSKHGYSLKIGSDKRIVALKKALREYEKNTVIRKLNVLSILHKNTNPLFSSRAKRDMEWIQKH